MSKRAARSQQRRVRVRRRLLVERLGDRRVLAAITGAVFDDANHSFQKEIGESGAANRLVFLDANNNSTLDAGEEFQLADAEGKFEFSGLSDGTYHLRLFNGSNSQIQTVPVLATQDGLTAPIANAIQMVTAGQSPITITSSAVVTGELSTGGTNTIQVADQLTKAQLLPSGNLLIIGSDSSGATTWEINPQTESITPLNLTGDVVPLSWADVAIGGTGHGVLLETTSAGDSSGELLGIRALDASTETKTLSGILQTVPIDAQVIASDSGNRSVFAWEEQNGLQLSLWSNITSSFITSTVVSDSVSTELLAFDDASGILAVRTENGGVSVHDADANFAPLHTLQDVTGPVAIDGSRDLLITVSPAEAMLKLINLRDGSLVADLAVDMSTIGQISAVAVGDSNDAITLLGAAGVTEVALRKATSREVTIVDGADVDSVLFGVSVSGENTAPTFQNTPSFQTNEDDPLVVAAPAALQGATDVDTDQIIIVQRTPASGGNSVVSPNGSLVYWPNADFNGTDAIEVQLHDGRDVSDVVNLNITVVAVPDAPTAIQIDIPPVFEDVVSGMPIGTIEVVDADGPDGAAHTIEVNDPRFAIQDGKLVFIGNALDFEAEPIITVGITVTDPETNTVLRRSTSVRVRDRNEPIEAILPHKATVFENDPGSEVASIEVEDPDNDDSHTVTVDDSRFVIEDFKLLLAEGVALDFEQEPVVIVNVTARDLGGDTFTQPIEVTVINIVEQPTSIELSGDSVMELVTGAEVGEVTVDGTEPAERFEFSVDDPRFEIDGTLLKLLDDVFVERANQDEIELQITATDRFGEFSSLTETFVIQVLENEEPHHNHDNPYDVDHNGVVTALDALAVINYLNANGPGPVASGSVGLCYDVNADGMVTALDALLILNELNRIPGGTVNGENAGAEGEQIADGFQLAPPITDNGTTGSSSDDDDQIDIGLIATDSDRDQVTDSTIAQFNGADGATLEIPDHQSADHFAANVDETLRLLSDEGDA